jgi:hypothetical protein
VARSALRFFLLDLPRGFCVQRLGEGRVEGVQPLFDPLGPRPVPGERPAKRRAGDRVAALAEQALQLEPQSLGRPE